MVLWGSFAFPLPTLLPYGGDWWRSNLCVPFGPRFTVEGWQEIPRLVLDSTNDEVSDLIEIHIFCDASKLAYDAAAYVKVRKQNEVLVNLITSKTRVAPLKAVTLLRLELLGALVAARLSSRVQEIVRKKKECKVFHWTDSKIVLFWIKGSSKRWKRWTGPAFLRTDELPKTVSECPELNEVDYLPELKSKGL
ncbi:integrase catalytic domain-containing protein [Trichonephila clavipes]|nr:integrase catalytic domain-containing protein [Trichonephila clavipes]